ncbi:MAG: hypothetical protein E7369_05045 [Clostridiales bacterium]|nr:hypothetical protein [Clostridiales bacterium]
MYNVLVLLKFYKGEISPFDQSALEVALSMKDAMVTVLALSPLTNKANLEYYTRLNVDRAILISDTIYSGSDTLATSKVLAKAVEKLKPDLVLCGRQSMDGDTAQVPPELAVMTGYNLVTNALEVKIGSVKTRLGGAEVKLPCVVSVERIASLRCASIRSKPKTVEVWDNSVLNIAETECGQKGSPTRVIKAQENTERQRTCKFINANELKELIPKLRSFDRKKQTEKTSLNKLENIFIVGDDLLGIASGLAKNCTVIDDDGDYISIANKIIAHNAKNVLFNATLKNRTLAPMVAAYLNAGLCADCTQLSTDGDVLIMTRPANSGNTIADIVCDKNYITMATVRTKQTANSEVIFGVGYGGVAYLNKIETFAKKYDAKVVGSRRVVDDNFLPYESQVGLTGKVICPKIYVAFGVSGAVQHIVGIENSDVIIAINKDRDAKIFDYADYGIIGDIEDVDL